MLFIFTGLAIYYRDPVRALWSAVGLPGAKLLAKFLYVLVPAFLILLTGFLGSVRVGGRLGFDWSGMQDLIHYLELPLINFEGQTAIIGFGPHIFNPGGLLIGLLPSKLAAPLIGSVYQVPFLLEPTLGAGFYGPLLWETGMPGVVVFSFLVGRLSKSFYNRAYSSLFHFLVYCLMSWALFAAHTYNHFLTLIFLYGPAFAFWLFALFLRSISRKEVPSTGNRYQKTQYRKTRY